MQPNPQKAFMLVTAVILMAVLGSALMYLTKMTARGQASSLYAYHAVKTYYAAQSGLEWGIYKALHKELCSDPNLDVGYAQPELANPDFLISVECRSHDYIEGPLTRTIMTVTATAEYTSQRGAATEGSELADKVIKTLRTTLTYAS